MGNLKTIHQVAENAKRISFDAIIATCIEQSQYELLAFNRGQLFMGTDSDLLSISPKYKSQEYALGKEMENPKPGFGTPDLFLTGSFYNGLGVVVNASRRTFTVNSKDEKAPKLELKYGSKIYGLDPESRSQYATEIIGPKIRSKYREQLFAGT